MFLAALEAHYAQVKVFAEQTMVQIPDDGLDLAMPTHFADMRLKLMLETIEVGPKLRLNLAAHVLPAHRARDLL